MKKLIAMAAVIMLLASPAFATGARVGGLGVPVWAMWDDDAAVGMFPSQAAVFGNRIVGEMGSEDSALFLIKVKPVTVGFTGAANALSNISFFSDWSAGDRVGVMEAVSDDIYDAYSAGYIAYPNVSASINSNLTGVLAAADLGGISAGLGVSFLPYDYKYGEAAGTNPYASSDNYSIIKISAGAGFTGNVAADIGVSATLLSVNKTYENWNLNKVVKNVNEKLKTDSGLIIDGAARAAVSGWTAMVGIQSVSTGFVMTGTRDSDFNGVLEYNGSDKTNLNKLGITAGACNNIKVSRELAVVLGGSFDYVSDTMKDVREEFIGAASRYSTEENVLEISVPLYAAAEVSLGDNWVIRGGVSRNAYYYTEYKDKEKNTADQVVVNTTDSRSENSDTSISLGFSWKVAGLKLDLLSNMDLVLSGPNFLSGISDNLSTQAAVTYEW